MSYVWPRAHAIVLHWKNYARTRNCLLSLRDATYPNAQVLVVDNGSEDGSIERLRSEFPEVDFFQNGANLGFSRGCNVGIRQALREGADYVLLLNNDMSVESGFLEPAIRAAEQDARVGLVTGKILSAEDRRRICQAGGYIHPFRLQGIPRGKDEIDCGQYDDIGETRWASGALMLIPRATLESVGFLPEEYFFGLEEWDYSMAVLRAGKRILYVPEFKAYHAEGAGYQDGHPVLIVYNGIRNKLIFAEKHLPRFARGLWKALFGVYLVTGWLWRAKAGCRTCADYRARAQAAWLAFRDHKGIVRIERIDLENAARRIGSTPTWGESWEKQEWTTDNTDSTEMK